MTLKIMTLSIMILSIMTLDIKTLRIVIKYDTEETITIRLSVAVMLSAIMLNVAILNVVAPSFSLAVNIRGIRVSVIICKTQHFFIVLSQNFA
jgi:hypothetical protein